MYELFYSVCSAICSKQASTPFQTSSISLDSTATLRKSITQQFEHNWLIIDKIYNCVKCDLSFMWPGL